MITLKQYTAEDALRKVFEDNPSSIYEVLHAKPDMTINFSLAQHFQLPAKYAKAILNTYLEELDE